MPENSPDDPACRVADGGVLIPLRVAPGASRDAVEGVHDGALRVRVSAAPEKGKANKAVLALLAGILGVPKRDVELIAGETSPRKRVRIRALEPGEVRARLAEAQEQTKG